MFRIISLLLVVLLTMANGKLEYTPYPSRAAYMAGVNYLLLSEADNLIGVNPGFELGATTGWVTLGAGTFTVTSGSPYEGTYKAQVVKGTYMDYEGIKNSDLFDLNRGQGYKLSFAHMVSSNRNIVAVIMDENNLVVTSFGSAVPLIASTTSWRLFVGNFTPDRDYHNCHIELSTSGIAGTVYFDDIRVTPEYLDMGLEDFSVDFLFQPLTQSAGERDIVGKLDRAVISRGWLLAYDWTDYKYKFYIGDGTNEITAAFATAVTQIQNQQYHWGRLVVDRSANATMYVNGSSVGTIDISTVTGNISVPDELRLFGWDSSTNRVKGWCDFIRFQRGTIRSAAWMASEWARIQAGRIRETSSATAIWDFNDNLVDECQGLILEENTGTTTYADGWPYCVSPISYTFGQNYTYDYQIIPVASDSLIRSYRTGAAYLTAGPRKYSYILPFTCIEEAQMSAFFAAWEGGEPVKLWLDANEEETDEVYFTDPPEKHSKAAFRAGNYVYDTELHLEGT